LNRKLRAANAAIGKIIAANAAIGKIIAANAAIGKIIAAGARKKKETCLNAESPAFQPETAVIEHSTSINRSDGGYQTWQEQEPYWSSAAE
jgi:hypothetical protein